MEKAKSVKEYIGSFESETADILFQIRQVVLEANPNLTESISYGMPAYKLGKKIIFYFAGYAKHIGVYATPTAHEEFATKLQSYKQGKGSVQFPLDQPIPYELIREMVLFNCQIEK